MVTLSPLKNNYLIMHNRFILFCLSLFFYITLQASPHDSISTRYNKGVFSTVAQLSITNNDSISNAVINLFVQQMCSDIKGLFKWGLKDMSLKNEEDELLVFDFKETRYNKQTGILKGIGDVIVPGVTTFKDLSVDSKLTLRTFPNGKKEVRLDLSKSNLFIREMQGSFYFYPKGNGRYGYLQVVTNIKFAWFFDVFITQKRYKSIMEWRLRQMILNIKEESDKRAHMQN